MNTQFLYLSNFKLINKRYAFIGINFCEIKSGFFLRLLFVLKEDPARFENAMKLFKDAQHLLFELLLWTNIELRDNKGHPKVYVFTKIIFFSFLKMWKFCVFLKSRVLPDNKTVGTSTEKL